VLKPGRGGDLPAEPQDIDVEGALGAVELEGDLTIMLEVAGEIDGGHPSPSELALETIVPVTGLWRRRCGHEQSVRVISEKCPGRGPHASVPGGALDDRHLFD
jgi:hypothetical protein